MDTEGRIGLELACYVHRTSHYLVEYRALISPVFENISRYCLGLKRSLVRTGF